MKKLLVGVVGSALLAASVPAQQGMVKLHTKPSLPSAEALDRMSLTMAWSARILLGGNRDGFYSIQLLPAGSSVQVLAQTFSGSVALFDGETGDLLWQAQVGTPYRVPQPAGYNDNSIFVIRRNVLYILNRATGLQRIYTTDKLSGVRTYGYELPYSPSAGPVAEDDMLYCVMSTRVMAFALPAYGAIDKFGKAADTGDGGAPLMPEPAWSYLIGNEFVQLPPLVAGSQVSVATASGTFLSINKFKGVVRDEFVTDGKVVAPVGQHGQWAYIGTDKATLYAFNMENQKLLWRFLPGGAVRRQPAVTDRDVFVAGDQVGLYRVSRDTGREIWLARQIDRFLAANDKFVYALHHSGEFHVLDYLRGSTLARYDLKDWTIPVANELSDRIYLGSNDGQIVCLRHRDLKAPLRYKLPPPPAKKEEKKEEKKDEDKKDDKNASLRVPHAPSLGVPLAALPHEPVVQAAAPQQARPLYCRLLP
jgi:outer membrane protein assembly factor BamB